MVDGCQRQIVGEGNGLRHLQPHKKRADQPRPVGDGHAAQFLKPAPGFFHGLGDDRVDAKKVLSGGQLRHHAAETPVNGNL